MLHFTARRFQPALCFGSLLLLVLGVEYLIIQRPDFGTRPALSAAVTFDLLVWPPVLFYALLVRHYRWPLTLVGAVFVAMLAATHFLIPLPQQHYLRAASYVLPLLEAAVGILVALNLRRLQQAYRAAQATTPDVAANLSAACVAVFKRPADALVFEAALWYHALLSWRAVPRQAAGQQAFSGHHQSGFVALLLTFAALSCIEAGAVHLLLARWNASVALAALGLNAYTVIFLVGHLRAVLLAPPVLLAASDELLLRSGLVWRLTTSSFNLKSVARITDVPPAAPGLLNMAKPLLTPPNLLLTFAEPVVASGPMVCASR